MVVTVYNDQFDYELLMRSDLALERTDERNWKGDRLYRVVKSRYGSNDALVPESEITEFVDKYEQQEQERKEGPWSGTQSLG